MAKTEGVHGAADRKYRPFYDWNNGALNSERCRVHHAVAMWQADGDLQYARDGETADSLTALQNAITFEFVQRGIDVMTLPSVGWH